MTEWALMIFLVFAHQEGGVVITRVFESEAECLSAQEEEIELVDVRQFEEPRSVCLERPKS